MSFSSLDDTAKVRASARRGQMAQATLYVIEGQYVSANDLAARLGVEKKKAMARYSKAKKSPGAVTWAKLGVADG